MWRHNDVNRATLLGFIYLRDDFQVRCFDYTNLPLIALLYRHITINFAFQNGYESRFNHRRRSNIPSTSLRIEFMLTRPQEAPRISSYSSQPSRAHYQQVHNSRHRSRKRSHNYGVTCVIWEIWNERSIGIYIGLKISNIVSPSLEPRVPQGFSATSPLCHPPEPSHV